MPTLQIYDQLLQFPLFQGMSRDDLEIVAGHTRFGFTKMPAGKQVLKNGSACQQMFFLINGSVKIQSYADDNGYSVEETVTAPHLLQLESAFGYYQRYTHDFTTTTDVNFLLLDKEEVVRLSEDFLVFRLNLMNLIATQTQKQLLQLWRRVTVSLQERISRFFIQRCAYPAGPKVFNILMERLAEELNDSRLNVSRALNQMQRDGLIELHRGRVVIPQLERLMF